MEEIRSVRHSNEDGKETVVVVNRHVGLFSLVFQVLANAYVADRNGLNVFPYFNKKCLYWSETGYRKKRNVWEYYYERISECEPDLCFSGSMKLIEEAGPTELAALAKNGILLSSTYHSLIEYYDIRRMLVQRKFVAGLLSKYARPRRYIKKAVETICTHNMIGKSTVGVHIRGAEKSSESRRYYCGKVVPPELTIKSAKKALNGQFDNVFLATDSAVWKRRFRDTFDDRVIILDHEDVNKQREEEGLLYGGRMSASLGREVLLEAMTLARCGLLIHGCSNISYYACFLNPDMPQVNLYDSVVC